MKAIVRANYGPPECLRFEERETPEPGADQVLVEVRASSVNPYDWHVMRGEPYLLRLPGEVRRPKSPAMGIDLAGTVAAVGEGVTQFAVGDNVFGSGVGTLAEFACAKEARIAKKPQALTFESAASMPCAGVTALQALRKGEVNSGQSVLINGAAGGVGTFAVQIAKSLGARVTGVCSAKNEELVRSIGADDVVDYANVDFARLATKHDVVLDTVGNRTLSDLRRALTPDGTLLLAAGAKGKWLRPVSLMLKGFAVSKFVHQRIHPVMANITQSDLLALAALVESGELAPVIDRTYTLSECAEAIRYLEEGHARGKVVVTI